MDLHLEETQKRNQLMIRLYGFSIVLAVLTQISGGSSAEAVYALLSVSVPSALFILFLIKKQIWPMAVRYLFVTSLSGVVLILFVHKPTLTALFLVYFTLGLASLYSDYKALLYAAGCGVGLMVYAFYFRREFVFPPLTTEPRHIITYSIILLNVTFMMIAQTRYNEKMRKKAEQNEESALRSKDGVERFLNATKQSLEALNRFNQELKKSLFQANQSSQQLKQSSLAVSENMASQTTQFSDIRTKIGTVEENVETVFQESQYMQNVSKETLEFTLDGGETVQRLKQEISLLNFVMQETFSLMREMHVQNQNIENLIGSINDISSKTDLLSINASIEASNAGSHGEGFQVVASEVKKLAVTSRTFTKEISEILQQLKEKTKEVEDRVIKGKQTAEQNQKFMQEVEQTFRNIEQNTHRVAERSDTVKQQVEHLRNFSAAISKGVSSVSYLNDQTSSSIDETVQNIEKQTGIIQGILRSFESLELETKELKDVFDSQQH